MIYILKYKKRKQHEKKTIHGHDNKSEKTKLFSVFGDEVCMLCRYTMISLVDNKKNIFFWSKSSVYRSHFFVKVYVSNFIQNY